MPKPVPGAPTEVVKCRKKNQTHTRSTLNNGFFDNAKNGQQENSLRSVVFRNQIRVPRRNWRNARMNQTHTCITSICDFLGELINNLHETSLRPHQGQSVSGKM